MLRAIVFDLDDTLYSERDYVVSGFRAVARKLSETGVADEDSITSEMVGNLDAGVRGSIFDRYLEDHGLDRDLVPSLVETYREHLPDLAPFPGVRPLLERLRDRFRLGIVSDGYLEVQRRKLEALGISDAFHAVVLSDELGRESWKPSPAPFERITELLEVSPEEAVYVGENVTKDFYGAKKIGMRTIRVLEPAGFYASAIAPSPDHAADLEIASLADLEAALDRLGSPTDRYASNG